jgi:hypothetical protein
MQYVIVNDKVEEDRKKKKKERDRMPCLRFNTGRRLCSYLLIEHGKQVHVHNVQQTKQML